MDFELLVNGVSYRFEQFQDLIQLMTQLLANWNNFESDQPIVLMVEKVDSGTETLEVVVEERINLEDLFGRP